jgi:hypothetical protein
MRLWQIASPVRANSAWPVAVALAAAILLAMPTRSQADSEPKRITMLHSFGLRFKPWTDYAETVRSEISRQARAPVIFHDHSLQNAQLQDDKSDGPFVDYLHALYEEKHPDLIIAFGAPAASFVQRHRDRLLPGTPMVFTAVEARRVRYDKLTENDAVVATHNDFAAAIENILQVLPGTKTIVIVNGASANELLGRRVTARACAIQQTSRAQMVHRPAVRRHFEKSSKSSASHRHFLALDER